MTGARAAFRAGELTPITVPASKVQTLNGRDIWQAQVPATASNTIAYFIALTDGAQSITPQQFADMMASIKRIAVAVDREV